MAVIPWADGMVLGEANLRRFHLRVCGMLDLVDGLRGRCLAMVAMETLGTSEMATVD